MPAVGASRGVGSGWEGLVGVGRPEEGRSRGKRSGPGGSGMQSEQCYRQWRKCRKGGGGQVRVVGVAGRGWGGFGRVGGPELGSGGRWRVVVVGASCYRCPTTGSDEGEDCLGIAAGEPGAEKWGAGGGFFPAGMAAVLWGPVGAEAPHVGWV